MRTWPLLLALPMAHAAGKDLWMQLAAMDRGNQYTVVLRGGRCETGKISKVTSGSLVVESVPPPAGPVASPQHTETVLRPDVLRVEEGIASGLVYSGRSSWADVFTTVPWPREHLTVVLKTGRKISDRLAQPSAAGIALLSGAKPMAISKQDISQVLYVRFKPLPGGYESLVEEAPYLALFTPRFWQNALKINAMMTVLLYDSAAAEDNSPVACAVP